MSPVTRFVQRVATVVRADLVRRIRNRSAIVVSFVAPLLLATVLGWILEGDRTLTIGIVDGDGSATSKVIVETLVGRDAGAGTDRRAGVDLPEGVQFVAVSADEAESRVIDNVLSAVIVIPSGYGAAGSGRPPALVVLRSPRRTVSGQIAVGVATAISDRVQRADVARVTASRRGLAFRPGGVDAVVLAAAAAPTPFPLREQDAGGTASLMAYFGASMCIVFLFFTVGYGARAVLIDRESGMLDRVLSTPTPLMAVVAGKSTVAALLGGFGFVGVWVVTTVGFGASWGDARAVLLMIVATVAAIGGVTVLVASIGRTERQAEAYATAFTLVLALLGGNFIPIGSAPQAFRRLALLTPNGWALRGFSDVSSGRRLAEVVVPAVVLVLLGIGAGSLGFLQLGRGQRR